jgi:periplasmic divalent cation tolerance protein
MTNFIFIYITNPSRKKAKEIAKHLLEKRLIACANIFPIESLYGWKKKIAEEKEFVLIAKTLEKNFEKVRKEVEKIHPYEVPCLIKIPVSSNEEYFRWLEREIG